VRVFALGIGVGLALCVLVTAAAVAASPKLSERDFNRLGFSEAIDQIHAGQPPKVRRTLKALARSFSTPDVKQTNKLFRWTESQAGE
jgi:hypothetical protein